MEDDQMLEETNNFRLFRLIISNSFKRIAESVREDDFLNTLTILKSKPNVARKLYKALVKELYDTMNDDLEDVLKEGGIQEALEKVAKLSDSNTSVHDELWRPPGNVSLHLRSLDAQKNKEETDKLSERVQEMEKENANLIEKITNQRSKISALHNDITQDLNKSPIAVQLLVERLEHLDKCLMLLHQE